MPRVTIGLPVHNGEAYLASALDALRAQTLTDFEVIVCDNASTDGTRAICETAAASDPRIQYIRHPENLGAAPNFNFAFAHARGEFFKWAFHDDLCAPQYLARCVEALDRAGERAVLAYPKTQWIDADGRTLGVYEEDLPWEGASAHTRVASLLGDMQRTHLHKCLPVCGLMRSAALRRTRLHGSFVSSDTVLLLELALLGDWVPVPEVLFLRRLHEDNSRANRSVEELAFWFDSRNPKRFPMPRTRRLWGYATAVARAPLPLSERLRCARPVARRIRQERRVILGEIKTGLRERLRRQPSRPTPEVTSR